GQAAAKRHLVLSAAVGLPAARGQGRRRPALGRRLEAIEDDLDAVEVRRGQGMRRERQAKGGRAGASLGPAGVVAELRTHAAARAEPVALVRRAGAALARGSALARPRWRARR